MGVTPETLKSALQLTKEFLLVHAVLEGLAAIDKDDGNFIVELPPKFSVGVYVDLVPGEPAAAGELGETLFNHLAEMATPARIHDNPARLWHAEEILARRLGRFQRESRPVSAMLCRGPGA
jgi:hypothetical protein